MKNKMPTILLTIDEAFSLVENENNVIDKLERAENDPDVFESNLNIIKNYLEDQFGESIKIINI